MAHIEFKDRIMQKVVKLSQTNISEHGGIGVRFSLRIMDGEDIVSEAYHRTMFTPWLDANEMVMSQMDMVNTHLAAMGWPVVPAHDIAAIETLANATWTSEVVAAYPKP